LDGPGPHTLNMARVFVSSSAGCSWLSTSILGDDLQDRLEVIHPVMVVSHCGAVLLRVNGVVALVAEGSALLPGFLDLAGTVTVFPQALTLQH